MSYIDSFNYVDCGFIDDLMTPVYWAFEGAYHENGQSISKHDLILGGGSGEGAMLVIKNVDLLVLQYIVLQIEESLLLLEEDNDKEKGLNQETKQIIQYKEKQIKELIEIFKKTCDDRNEKISINNYFIHIKSFADISCWSIQEISYIQKSFVEYCKYQKETKLETAEEYFLYSIAVFAFKNMPKNFFGKEIYEKINEFEEFFKKDIMNIKSSKGCSNNFSGKIIKNNEAVFGYNLDAYNEDHLPIEEKQMLEAVIEAKNKPNVVFKL